MPRCASNSGTPQRNVTLPQTAIAYNPYGSTVFLVEDKGKDDTGEPKLVARQAFVTTGATRGDQVAVLKGVNEGDTVVTAGQHKLQKGSLVTVDNTVSRRTIRNPTTGGSIGVANEIHGPIHPPAGAGERSSA